MEIISYDTCEVIRKVILLNGAADGTVADGAVIGITSNASGLIITGEVTVNDVHILDSGILDISEKTIARFGSIKVEVGDSLSVTIEYTFEVLGAGISTD